MANDLALVVALAAMATIFIGQLTSPAPAEQLAGITARVVRFQVSAFVLLEVLERVTAGVPLAELVHTGILPIGVAVQVGIGYLAARAIRWLLRAADRVAAALGRAGRDFPPGRSASAPAGAGLRPGRTPPLGRRRPRSPFLRLIDARSRLRCATIRR